MGAGQPEKKPRQKLSRARLRVDKRLDWQSKLCKRNPWFTGRSSPAGEGRVNGTHSEHCYDQAVEAARTGSRTAVTLQALEAPEALEAPPPMLYIDNNEVVGGPSV